MFRLALVLYSIAATVLIGTFVTIVLVMGYGTLIPIMIAVLIGTLGAAPLAYFSAGKMMKISNKRV